MGINRYTDNIKEGGRATGKRVEWNLFDKPVIRKGSFNEIEGDLIKLAKAGNFDFIGHGCNCFATMGAGIALPIGIAFPEAKRADINFEAPSYMRLGNFTIGLQRVPISSKEHHPLRIVNFYSQYNGGKNLDVEALILSLRKFATFRRTSTIFNKDQYRIGLPLIGCGIAGGNWAKIKKIVAKELHEFDVTIVHFKE